MRTDSVKKYVIPNIPYLFILWACLKLGTAYANSHFLRTAGPHFPDSPGHIKRTAWDISRAEGTPPY